MEVAALKPRPFLQPSTPPAIRHAESLPQWCERSILDATGHSFPQHFAIPLRLMVRGWPSLASPFAGEKVHRTFFYSGSPIAAVVPLRAVVHAA